ncbi:mCG148261 [Mus musculus]|nr:mCG148261 [Mus musculus]
MGSWKNHGRKKSGRHSASKRERKTQKPGMGSRAGHRLLFSLICLFVCLFFIGYFLYLHFKFYPLSSPRNTFIPSLSPCFYEDVPLSTHSNVPTLRERAFTGPRAASPIDV